MMTALALGKSPLKDQLIKVINQLLKKQNAKIDRIVENNVAELNRHDQKLDTILLKFDSWKEIQNNNEIKIYK